MTKCIIIALGIGLFLRLIRGLAKTATPADDAAERQMQDERKETTND